MTALGAAPRLPHFRPGGDFYSQIPDVVWTLEPTYHRPVALVCRIIINADKRGELAGNRAELLTNEEIRRRIQAETGRRYSLTFIKKGLYGLSRVLGAKGLAVIERVRRHGRRIITLLRGLRRSGEKQPGPGEPIVSRPPPPEENNDDTTTTGGPSSSSLQTSPEETEGPDPAVVDALYDRARRLVDDVSRGDVRDAVSVFTAEWVGKALDVVERRNRKPGNVRKPWGYVTGILWNRRKKGDWPDDPRPAPKAPAPRVQAAEDEPPRRLTAEELADLLAKCEEGDRFTKKAYRASLRLAVRDGVVPPELLATIPAELLEPHRRE
jgi:hypothetical protein